MLNTSKTVMMTQAQPPPRVWLDASTCIDVICNTSSHRWLGCQLTMRGQLDADVDFHLQAASRAFWSKKWILCDKKVPLRLRIELFDAVVTPVACFAAGHRKIYQRHLVKFDVEWRRLLRTMFGPPPEMDWNLPWHEIPHAWKQKVRNISEHFHMKPWSTHSLKHYWTLAA